MVKPDWRLILLLQLMFTVVLWPFLIQLAALYSLLLVILWVLPYERVPRLYRLTRTRIGKAVLTAIGLALLAVSAMSVGIVRTLMSYLLMAAALKLFEFTKKRDLGALVVIYLFLTAMILILDQGWGMMFISFVILGITGILVNQNFVTLPLKQHGRIVWRISLAAIPLTVLLFVVFPRLGPLWKVPQANLGQTGLSESMSPGDFSALGRAAELAFRASFNGSVPTQPELYWRALVFEQFDGKAWAIHPATQLMHQQHTRLSHVAEPRAPIRFRYQVITEPSGQPWLFALASPWSAQSGVFTLPDMRLIRDRVVNQNFQYQAYAYADIESKPLLPPIKARNVQLPALGGQKSREFAQTLLEDAGSEEAWAQALLRYFSTEAFYYTLQPGVYVNDPIDEFMFERRKGFCGHYASAMAFMARSVGIPARVVAGYQGGEWDPQREYLSVYQFDAHAWVELFIPNKGWQRYDPTAAVAPQRVLDGMGDLLADEASFLADSPFSLLRFKDNALLNQLRWAMANMDYYWTVWILGFDAARQTQFWQQLFGEVAWLGKLVLFILAIMSPAVVLLLWKRERLSTHAHWRYYHHLIPACEKAGWPLRHGTTPRQYANKVAHDAPSVGQPFMAMVQLCYEIEYGASANAPQQIKQIKAHAKQIRRAIAHWQRASNKA